MAMIGVLFISDDAKPTGNSSGSATVEGWTLPRIRESPEKQSRCAQRYGDDEHRGHGDHARADRPPSNSLLGATPSTPARVSVAASSTGGTRPEARAIRQPRISRVATSTKWGPRTTGG